MQRPRRPLWIFRLVLPIVYAMVGGILLAGCVFAIGLGAGHGNPPPWIPSALRALAMPWELWGLGIPGFFVNMCILAGLGYLMDRGIARLLRLR